MAHRADLFVEKRIEQGYCLVEATHRQIGNEFYILIRRMLTQGNLYEAKKSLCRYKAVGPMGHEK